MAKANISSLKRLLAGPVARGGSYALLIRVFAICLGVVQAILTARLLGPAGYGIVAVVFASASVFATVTMFGSGPYSTREIARLRSLNDTNGEVGFVYRTVILVIVFSVLLAGAFILVMRLVSFEDSSPLLVYGEFCVMLFPLIAIALLLQGILNGVGSVVWALTPFNALRPLIFVSFLSFIYIAGYALNPEKYLWAMLIVTAGCLIVAMVRFIVYIRNVPCADAQLPSHSTWILGAYPFLVIGLIDIVTANFGTFMLVWWADSHEAGLFQPVVRVLPLLMLANQAIGARFAPRISEFHATHQIERLRELTGKVTAVSTFGTISFSVLLIIFSEWILGFFGSEFVPIAPAFLWIAGAQIFNAVTGPSLQMLAMTGNAHKAIFPQVVGLLAMVFAGVNFVPGGGAVGAAQAVAVGLVVLHFLAHRAAYQHVGIDTSVLNSLKIAMRT